MKHVSNASSTPELFGAAWAERLERELEASTSYRAAASSWTGSLAFVLLPDGSPGFSDRRELFLHLTHGNARSVRPALAGDTARATFCLQGPAATWRRLLTGDLEPGAAVMGGGLKLVRGSMFSLFPHLKAAQALFECARAVPFEEAQ